ncbi:HAD family phosphatase [Nocardia sp. NPDC048505]|uniref:HAD family hydrolase n=1 Tax=unclassified Nocardia TaxID=2637762 RepID=UPI0033CF5E0F
MSEPVRAVLFDLDGTLAATMEPWDTCWFDYAARHGHAWTDADRQQTHGCGDWAHHLAQVCGARSRDQVVTDCVDRMLEHLCAGNIELLPGVRELLAAAATVPTGVVSASPQRFVHAVLEHFDLHRTFAIVVTREDHESTKPHPAPYLHAAGQLGVHPKHSVAVEDSAAGIRSAYTAGMRVLAIPSWPPTRSAHEAALADHLAADAAQAGRWLRDQLSTTARRTG